MTAPDTFAYTRPGEADDDTMCAAAYCDHCDQVTTTDVTRHRGVYTFTCPDCGHHNEIQE